MKSKVKVVVLLFFLTVTNTLLLNQRSSINNNNLETISLAGSYVQTYEKLWEIEIDNGDQEIPKSVVATSDNSFVYILTQNRSYYKDYPSVNLYKYSYERVFKWKINWNDSLYCYPKKIQISQNNSFIYFIAKTWESALSQYRISISKYNPDGNSIWNKTFGEGDGKVDSPYDFILDSNDNLYVLGYNEEMSYVLKYNSNGNKVWQFNASKKHQNIQVFCQGIDISQDESKIFLFGTDISGSNRNGTILIINNVGESIKNLTYYEVGKKYGYNQGTYSDSENCFYITGFENEDWLTAKISYSGVKLWNYTVISERADTGHDIEMDESKNFLFVSGEFHKWSGDSERVLMSLGASKGNYQWDDRLNKSGYNIGLDIFVGANNILYFLEYRENFNLNRINGSLWAIKYNNIFIGDKPNAPILSPITPNPLINGTIFLNWTCDSDIDSYTLYFNTSEINSSNYENAFNISGIIHNNKTIQINTSGPYFFSVQAINEYGESDLSNCVSVNVTLVSGDGFEILFWIILPAGVAISIVLSTSIFIRKRKKMSQKVLKKDPQDKNSI